MIDRIIIYGALIILLMTGAKIVKFGFDRVQVGLEYEHVTCGEALNRSNGSAAPRDKKEYKQYKECITRGVKKWDK